MDPATYRQRRQTLRAAVPDGLLLILGGNDAPRNYVANVYPFRQDSQFLYFAGVSQQGMALVLEPDGTELLYGAPDDPDDLIWHGPHPGLGDHAATAGVTFFKGLAELGPDLRAARSRGLAVHYLPPYRAERSFQLAELLACDPCQVAAGASAALARAVMTQRVVKSDAEIAEMEAALAVTARMYAAAMAATKPGRSEAEVAAALVAPAVAADCQQAFNPIVSVRGEVLHNTSYHNTLAAGDLLLVDSGAEASRSFYCSDITRTLPVSGRFSSEQREVYEVVLAAQMAAIAAASPERSNRELHFVAARAIASGLKDLGLMQGDVEAAVAAGAHALFFPHGIGHMLGLDVHDMEDLGDVVGYDEGDARSTQFGLAYLRLARRLAPGWVITVEPGVYFIPALIDRWQGEGRHRDFIRYDRLDRYRRFGGIRIEDDVLITATGHRVLGPGIPKTVTELEALLGG